MIEIKAKTGGDETTLELTVKGSAKDIGREAAEILINFPISLQDNAPLAFIVMKKEFAERVHGAREEVETITEVYDGKCN